MTFEKLMKHVAKKHPDIDPSVKLELERYAVHLLSGQKKTDDDLTDKQLTEAIDQHVKVLQS